MSDVDELETIETKLIDGQIWVRLPSGYTVVPIEATSTMFMCAGNVPISNLGKLGLDRKGRIGDEAARDAWDVMVHIATRDNKTIRSLDI
jgi:hypothetical protein